MKFTFTSYEFGVLNVYIKLELYTATIMHKHKSPSRPSTCCDEMCVESCIKKLTTLGPGKMESYL
jgi:hypothetical protein